MAGFTEHYGFQRLRAGIDTFAENGSKFTDEDRVLMDRLLYLALTGHHHLGQTDVDIELTDPPELTLDDGGALPAGERIFYVYTLVDANGSESAPSPEAWVDTPDPVTEPNSASLSRATTGGALLPGPYYYTLSAYTGANTLDTRAPNVATISVPATTNTNTITINLPSLPSGADGFNIYRRKPGQAEYFYLDSVDMTGGSPPTTYLDDGSVEEDCDRRPSSSNSTSSDNSVVVTYPGGTPVIPEGYTWKIYRSYTSGTYSDSLLHWVVEETEEGSGVITPEYTDVGTAVEPGSPPPVSQLASNPSQVDLETETTGVLPPSRVAAFPVLFEFSFPGVAEVMQGPEVWANPYPAMNVTGFSVTVGWDEDEAEMAANETDSTFISLMRSSGGVSWDEVTAVELPPAAIYAEETDVLDQPEQGDLYRVDITDIGSSPTPSRPTDLRVQVSGWVAVEDPTSYPS